MMHRVLVGLTLLVALVITFPSAQGARIVNGKVAPRGMFPYLTYLTITSNDTRRTPPDSNLYACGGTLVAPNYVLTAAHCLSYDTGEVVTGVTSKYNVINVESEAGIQRKAVRWWVHPNYDNSLYTNDIAVLELEPSPLSASVAFAKLVTPRLDAQLTRAGAFSYIAGWGTTSDSAQDGSPDLLYATTKLTDEGTCQEYWDYTSPWPSYFTIDYTTQLCAAVDPSDVCHGDSGGPLSVVSSSQLWQAAVVSYGWGCGPQDVPGYGVYTRVAGFAEFICKHTDALRFSPSNVDFCGAEGKVNPIKRPTAVASPTTVASPTSSPTRTPSVASRRVLSRLPTVTPPHAVSARITALAKSSAAPVRIPTPTTVARKRAR